MLFVNLKYYNSFIPCSTKCQENFMEQGIGLVIGMVLCCCFVEVVIVFAILLQFVLLLCFFIIIIILFCFFTFYLIYSFLGFSLRGVEFWGGWSLEGGVFGGDFKKHCFRVVLFLLIIYGYLMSRITKITGKEKCCSTISCGLPKSMLSGQMLRCTQVLIEHYTKVGDM